MFTSRADTNALVSAYQSGLRVHYAAIKPWTDDGLGAHGPMMGSSTKALATNWRASTRSSGSRCSTSTPRMLRGHGRRSWHHRNA